MSLWWLDATCLFWTSSVSILVYVQHRTCQLIYKGLVNNVTASRNSGSTKQQTKRCIYKICMRDMEKSFLKEEDPVHCWHLGSSFWTTLPSCTACHRIRLHRILHPSSSDFMLVLFSSSSTGFSLWLYYCYLPELSILPFTPISHRYVWSSGEGIIWAQWQIWASQVQSSQKKRCGRKRKEPGAGLGFGLGWVWDVNT